jgi:hypothetical protein
VSQVTQKLFDLVLINLTGMLLSAWGFACGVFAIDLVNIWNFQLVSHVTQKVFDLES